MSTITHYFCYCDCAFYYYYLVLIHETNSCFIFVGNTMSTQSEYDFSHLNRFFLVKRTQESELTQTLGQLVENEDINTDIVDALEMVYKQRHMDLLTYLVNNLQRRHTCYYIYVYLKFLCMEESEQTRFVENFIDPIINNSKSFELIEWMGFLYDVMQSEELAKMMDVNEPITNIKNLDCAQAQGDDNFFINKFETFVHNYKGMEAIYRLVYLFSTLETDTETNQTHARDDFIMRFQMNVPSFLDMKTYYDDGFYKDVQEKKTKEPRQKFVVCRKSIDNSPSVREMNEIKDLFFAHIMRPMTHMMRFHYYMKKQLEYDILFPTDKFKLDEYINYRYEESVFIKFNTQIEHFNRLKYVMQVFTYAETFNHEKNGITAEDLTEFKDFLANFLTQFSFTDEKFEFVSSNTYCRIKLK